MSTHFGGGGSNGGSGDGDAGESRGRADDLRVLIERIAQQLTDADHRQTATLSQMLTRVEALSAEARSHKTRVPKEYLAAFERIEDGVNLLAERIAASHSDFAREEFAAAQVAKVVTAPIEPAPDSTKRAEQPAKTVAEPAPEAAATAATSTAAANAPFMPEHSADTVLANDDNAWDQAAADALTSHYENAFGNLAGEIDNLHEPAGDISDAAVTANLPQALMAVLPKDLKAGLLDSERDWLEERFVEIARKVEDTLAGARPDPELHNLGERFNQFEQQFGATMSGVATRSDVLGLHELESHIAGLTQQFEETRSQLGRLDNIENSLAAVIDRLTDPRFDDALDRHIPPAENIEPLISAAVQQISAELKASQPRMPDFADIADAAAERVASRFADMGPANVAGNGEDAHAIRQLLEQFVTERREGEEQTAAMLDTMQRAMIRMLDRVDALEINNVKAAQQDFMRDQPRYPSEASTAVHAMPTAHQPAGNVQPPRVQSHDAEYAAEPRQHAGPAAPVSNPAAAAAAATPSSPATIERLRQDFIADARRAKAKIASSAPSEHEIGAELTPRTPISDRLSTSAPLSKPRPAVAESTGQEAARVSAVSRLRAPSRKLLVSAIVLMIAIPGVLMMLKKKRAPEATPVAIEKTQAPSDRSITPVKPAAQTNEAVPQVTTQPMQPEGPKSPQSAPQLAPKGEMAPNPESTPRSDKSSRGETMGPTQAPAADMKPAQAPVQGEGGAAPRVNKDDLFRTHPKTRTRGLDQDLEVPAENYAPRNSSLEQAPFDAEGPPPGITVAHPKNQPTLEQLRRLDERLTTAQLSNQLGAAQVQAVPAALIPEFMQSGSNAARSGTASAPVVSAPVMSAPVATAPAASAATAQLSDAHRKALDLPPAAVGPLSMRLAAAKGDASAEFAVAARLAEGSGVKQDLAEALRWYQRSAARGFVQSQYRLATFYERGLGIEADMARAKNWYQRAAEGGNVKAMHNLAVLSAGRTAKTPDYNSAARWFQAAADHGLADSQYNLAVLYENGLGVAKDLKQAFHWYALAARNGDAEAQRRQKELEASMAGGELEAARRLIDAWRPKQAERIANDAVAAAEAWKARATADGAV